MSSSIPRPRKALTLIAFVAFISLGLPDGVLGVAWPSMRDTFGLPISYLGLLVASGTCGYLVSSFSSGAVVARLGVGKVLLLSSLLMVGASAGFALAPVWPVMLIMGVCAGLGSGSIDAGLNAFAAQHFSHRVMNWLHAFYGVGATIGPLLMTGVLSAGLIWRWGYAVNAVLLAIMSLCFLLTLKLWQTPVAAESHEPVGTIKTLRRPVVLLSIVLLFLYTGLEVAVGQWTYTLFTKSRGVDPAVAGVWVGIYWASLTAGRIFFGIFAAQLPPLAVVRSVMLIAPLGAVVIWLNLHSTLSFIAFALMGFCFAPMFPLLMSLTPERVGARAAHQVIGFEVSAAGIGGAGIAGLTGMLARRTGLEVIAPTFLIVAVLLFVVHEAIVWTASRELRK
jgi:fucose permease